MLPESHDSVPARWVFWDLKKSVVKLKDKFILHWELLQHMTWHDTRCVFGVVVLQNQFRSNQMPPYLCLEFDFSFSWTSITNAQLQCQYRQNWNMILRKIKQLKVYIITRQCCMLHVRSLNYTDDIPVHRGCVQASLWSSHSCNLQMRGPYFQNGVIVNPVNKFFKRLSWLAHLSIP